MQWWLEKFLRRVPLHLNFSFDLVHLVHRALSADVEELSPSMSTDAAGRLLPQASPWPSKVASQLSGKHNWRA